MCTQGQVELISRGSCKRVGHFTTVLEALCSYQVQVLSLNTISFYGYAESFFTIEMKGEQDVVTVELIATHGHHVLVCWKGSDRHESGH
ncbi:hypothetical protein E2562_038463 [Oryza meyeriana var. granulata]|uniref:Uncharacterized protein n=1 Tax=Oryza meyeriana var. granulata TaxID=110450 RepID=A0A6G1E8N7_9ORYZ|nr:hypothetical protein E2562_038463 [Oryza meyeriana var. granulata]